MRWTEPAAAFREVAAGHPRMFWLDGGGSRAWSGRRSIIGWLAEDDVSLTYNAAAREVWRHQGERCDLVGDDIFGVLESAIARDGEDPSVSWVGYLGYAARPDLPALVAPRRVRQAVADGGVRQGVRVPDAMWMRVRNPLVFEHPAPAAGVTGTGPVEPVENADRAPGLSRYRVGYDRVQEQLRLGNSYEVNLTYRQVAEAEVEPAVAYLRLRLLNPAPYACYLQHHGVRVLSSSPERFATVDRQRNVETKPIKGTTPRGRTPEEDERLARSLATDPRFRSENLMIVDLLRNDLSMVCEPGSVTVPGLMQVESYPSVHQLVSTIRGHLRDDVSTMQALRALFPAGSMTGAPKLRTMSVIADVETTPRGVYAGALGWISGDGRADLGVVIRTLVARGTGPYSYELGTGGGVTVGSDARSEYDETRWKAARLMAALRPSRSPS